MSLVFKAELNRRFIELKSGEELLEEKFHNLWIFYKKSEGIYTQS